MGDNKILYLFTAYKASRVADLSRFTTSRKPVVNATQIITL